MRLYYEQQAYFIFVIAHFSQCMFIFFFFMGTKLLQQRLLTLTNEPATYKYIADLYSIHCIWPL